MSLAVLIMTARDLGKRPLDQLLQPRTIGSSASADLIDNELQPIMQPLVALQWSERIDLRRKPVETLKAVAQMMKPILEEFLIKSKVLI
jgi:hypothetical protein